LVVKCPRNALQAADNPAAQFYPRAWLDLATTTAPTQRPWTVPELQEVVPEQWVLQQPFVDASVGVCPQTHGGRGEERWRQFVANGLGAYARRRNDIRQPHAVSRMSCYLNLGTVSILQMVHDLWQDPRDTSKFQDEIIQWREIGYAHTFASPRYFQVEAVPAWAREYLNRQLPKQPNGREQPQQPPVSWDDLAAGNTRDATWNAMQRYLVETGELHNNARMTWGKTVVEWQTVGGGTALPELLVQLATLNDRFALDGLSPPSYAGLLWCLGWGDKPGANGEITPKPASRYRVGPDGFGLARRRLLLGRDDGAHGQQLTIADAFQRLHPSLSSPNKKARLDEKNAKETSKKSSTKESIRKKKKHRITDYFAAARDEVVG